MMWVMSYYKALCHPERMKDLKRGYRDDNDLAGRCFDYAQHDKSALTPPHALALTLHTAQRSCGYIKVYPQPLPTTPLPHPQVAPHIAGIIFNTHDV